MHVIWEPQAKTDTCDYNPASQLDARVISEMLPRLPADSTHPPSSSAVHSCNSIQVMSPHVI